MDVAAALAAFTWADAAGWARYIATSLFILYSIAAVQVFFGVCNWRLRQKAE
jgi:hypothetical protein